MNLVKLGNDANGHEVVINGDQITDIQRVAYPNQPVFVYVTVAVPSAGNARRISFRDTEADAVWQWATKNAHSGV